MGKTYIFNEIQKNIASDLKTLIEQSLKIDLTDNFDTLYLKTNSGKRSIGIDKVRELKQWARTKPFSGENKIIIIEEAHNLTIEAQNSLLKILEEPNASTTIILVTNVINKLLETIRSRCVVINLNSEKTDNFNKNSKIIDFNGLLDKIESIIKLEDLQEQANEINNLLIQLCEIERINLFHKFKSKFAIENINLIHETQSLIQNFTSFKLALENLLLNYYI